MALYRVRAWLTKPDGVQFEDEGIDVNPHKAALAAVMRLAENHRVEPGDTIEVDTDVERYDLDDDA